MAYVTNTQTQATGLYATIAQFFAKAAEDVERRRIYNRTYNELSALNNRDLSDLGISRSMISQVAKDAAEQAQIRL